MTRVVLGHVVRAHGIRGAVRVRPASGRAQGTLELLGSLSKLYLGGAPCAVRRARVDKDDLLLELDTLTNRDQAEAARGQALEVDREQMPPPAEDELYLADVVGCTVVDRAGATLGRVTGSVDTGAHETLIVETSQGERLLPFIEPLVVAVDLETRRIVYDPPVGLLDLDQAEEG